jgi:hypothetical protein
MPETVIQIDPTQLSEVQHALGFVRNGVPRALSSAVNKTGAWVKTRTLRAITSSLAIKRRDIDANKAGAHRFGGVLLTKGSASRPSARVFVTGRRIPLYRLDVRPAEPPSRKGVSWRVWKGGGRTTVKQALFVARMPSGHMGVFKRRAATSPKHGLPIQEAFGPSIPIVALRRPEFGQLLQVDASGYLAQQLDSQVDRLLKRPKSPPPAESLTDEGGD